MLVAHGSRDLRSQQSFQQLTDLFRYSAVQKGIPPQHIHGGTLEFGRPLEEQLQQIGKALPAGQTVKILPLFLLAGMHMMSDIPQACLLYTSPSPRDLSTSRMPSSA